MTSKDDFWKTRTEVVEILRKRGVGDGDINAILRDLLPFLSREVKAGQRRELEHWVTFFEDPSMNALPPSDRLRKRLAELEESE